MRLFYQKEGHSNHLYNYQTETFDEIKTTYQRLKNKIISVNQWYETPNLKFRLVIIPKKDLKGINNIIITLRTVNNAVNNIVSNISVNFDNELSSIMYHKNKVIILKEL